MNGVSGELTLILITNRWLQKLGENLAVSKQEAQKFDGERFCHRKLSDLQLRNSIRFGFQICL